MTNNQVHGIRDFYKQATKSQFMRDFNFRVTLVNTVELSLTSEEIVYATATTLPGRKITNQQQSFMGLPLNYGGSATYPGSDTYKITFFMDESGSMREKLERASRTVFNDVSSTGNYRVPGTENVINLTLVDPKLQPLKVYTLKGAQFRTIGDLTFDYLEGNGKLVRCDCELSYQWYEVSDNSHNVIVS